MPFFFSARSPTDSGNDGGGGAAAAASASASNETDDHVKNTKKGKTSTMGSRIRTVLLLHVLTALLPPIESKDELKSTEYYKVLGLKKNATPEQIRKAYKQKSLALHPDKVAQRRQRQAQAQTRSSRRNNTTTTTTPDNAAENNIHLTEEQAADLFLKVQEAHAVLSDAHNRQVYHEFGCSPARYKFVHDNAESGDGGGSGAAALHHPMMLYENLTKATFVNKTRLVSVFTLFILFALTQPILICAKINQELNHNNDNDDTNNNHGGLQNTPWSVILIPFWIVYGVFFMSIQVLLVCYSSSWGRINNNNWQVRWFALQHFMFLIGMILLVQVWDGHRTSSTLSWHALSTPFYLVIFCRVAGMSATARDLLNVVHTRMASLEHLQQTEPRPVRQPRRNDNNNNSGGNETDEDDEDDDDFLTEEEWITQLSEKYVIVTPDPQIVEAHVVLWHEEHDRVENNNNINNNEEPSSPTSRCEIPEEDMESIRIASSLEYQSAMEQVQMLQRSAGKFFVYGIVMIALIAAKLTPSQLATKSSWWAIFTPMWIYLALEMMTALSLCCCSGLAAGNNEGVIILASAAAAATASSSTSSPAAGATGESLPNQNGNDVENQQPQQQQQQQGDLTATTTTYSPNNNKEQFQDEHIQNQEQQQRPASSINWAKAEGSMELPSITTTTPNDHDDNASLTPSDEGCFDRKRSPDPPGMMAEEAVQQQQKDPPGVTAAALSNGQEGGDTGVASGTPPSHGEQQQQQQRQPGGDGHGDDDEMPRFDEETYHRWQQAHAAAESSAMEAQAKGQWQCCVAIFQLIILCLVVGKLQDDYHPEQQDPSQTGYNAFWILFPIFFLAGILVCCCSCLIYTSGSASELDDSVKAQGGGDADNNEGNDTESNANQTGNNNEASNGSSPTIPLAAPPAPTQATTTTTTQGELPGQPMASKHQPTAAAAAAAATVQPHTETVPGMGFGGDIENGMDDLD